MRKLAVLALLCVSCQAAITVPGTVGTNWGCFQLSSSGGTTSPALDLTSGATITHLTVAVSGYSLGTVPPTSFSDSPGNTFTGRTAQGSSEPWIRVYDVDNPMVSASYTVSISSSMIYASVCIIPMAGTLTSSSWDSTAGTDNAVNDNASGTSVQAGTNFIPTNAGEILVTFLSYSLPNTPTLTTAGSFGAVTKADYATTQNEGIAMSIWIQTTATNVQPTWNWTTPTRGVMTLNAYQAAGAGPTAATRSRGFTF